MALGDPSLPAVLLTNDDGIDAPGIKALAAVLGNAGFCRVFVIAPDVERSGASHAITTRESLEANLIESYDGAVAAYSLSGTPADCTSVGLSEQVLKGLKPLLVISGINKGGNTGPQTLYSGTVAAAREALLLSVPSLALSLDWSSKSSDSLFTSAASTCLPLLRVAVEAAVAGNVSPNFFLNINVPADPLASKGFRFSLLSDVRLSMPWKLIARRRTGYQLAAGFMAPNLSAPSSSSSASPSAKPFVLPPVTARPAGGKAVLPGAGMGPMAMAQMNLAAAAAAAAKKSASSSLPGGDAASSGDISNGSESKGSNDDDQLLHKLMLHREIAGWRKPNDDELSEFTLLSRGHVTATPLSLYAPLDYRTLPEADISWLSPLLSQ